MEIKETEQWLLNGNCSKCRKKNYCSKECKRNDLRKKRIIANTITKTMDERTNGLYSQIMNHLYKKN